MKFHLQACRIRLAARGPLHFPAGSSGNILRGALGSVFRKIVCSGDCPGHAGRNVHECPHQTTCAYARIFEPFATGAGPSGLSDQPRPFVLRAAELEGRSLQSGEQFCFGLHLFDASARDYLVQAFSQWADLVSVEQSDVSIDLHPQSMPISRIRVEFQTPTELKSAAPRPMADFPLLFARARDRVSTLRSLYGTGPLEIDFPGLAERAQFVQTVRAEIRRVGVERRSSRTGQRHGIGGFTGTAEYEGDLTEFVPYLEAAHWTGVGRHCTWGNGQIETTILNSEF